MGSKKTQTPKGNSVTKKGPKSTKTGDDKKLKRRRRRNETYSAYIYKVLKQVHKDAKISQTSMNVMNSFITDLFERLSLEASKLARMRKKATLSARDIRTSVKLLLPEELAKHALREGSKAVTKFTKA